MTGIIVPLYTYPTDGTWDRLIALRTAHPSVAVIVIINPDSGPGLVLDPNYVEGVKRLQQRMVVLGYVATGWGSFASPNAVGQASDYKRWYGVNGIFWDEFAARPGQEAYYRTLVTEARQLGLAPMVGNPGTQASPTYLPLVDIMIQYEGIGLPDPRSTANYLAYNVPSLPASFPRPDWLYITDDGADGNPWDSLSSYLDALFVALEASPVTPVRNNFTLITPDGRTYSW